MASPRLGEGLAGPGRLKEDAVQRTLEALGRIRIELQQLGVVQFRAVATEALRLAGNSGDFLRRSAGRGLEVEIISGEEEARLVLRGALSGLPFAGGKTILADVGGGSTELIPAGPGRSVSLPLGAVRLKEKFSPGRDPDDLRLERMREHCRLVLQESAAGFAGADTLIGIGGTFTTLAAIRLGLAVYDGDRVHGLELSGQETEEISFRLRGLSPEGRCGLAGLDPARADIIIPGTVIVRALLEHLALDRVTVSDRGLLFGLLAESAAPSRP